MKMIYRKLPKTASLPVTRHQQSVFHLLQRMKAQSAVSCYRSAKSKKLQAAFSCVLLQLDNADLKFGLPDILLLISGRLRPFYVAGLPRDLFCLTVRIIVPHLTIRYSKLNSGGTVRHCGALITRLEATLVYFDPVILHKDRDGRYVRSIPFHFLLSRCDLANKRRYQKRYSDSR